MGLLYDTVDGVIRVVSWNLTGEETTLLDVSIKIAQALGLA
jgi:hypothetical protein